MTALLVVLVAALGFSGCQDKDVPPPVIDRYLKNAPEQLQGLDEIKNCGIENLLGLERGTDFAALEARVCMRQAIRTGEAAEMRLVVPGNGAGPYSHLIRVRDDDLLVISKYHHRRYDSANWHVRTCPREFIADEAIPFRHCGDDLAVKEGTPLTLLDRSTLQDCGRVRTDDTQTFRQVMKVTTCVAQHSGVEYTLKEFELEQPRLRLVRKREGSVEVFEDANGSGANDDAWTFYRCDDLDLRLVYLDGKFEGAATWFPVDCDDPEPLDPGATELPD